MGPARILRGSRGPRLLAFWKCRPETNARRRTRREPAGGALFRRGSAAQRRRKAPPIFAMQIAQPNPTMMFSFSRSFRGLALATLMLTKTCHAHAAHIKR